MTHHVYEDAYVKRLETTNKVVMLLLGLCLGLGGFSLYRVGLYSLAQNHALNASYELIEALKEGINDRDEALAPYTKKKDQITKLIQRTNPKMPKAQAEKIAALEMKYSQETGVPLHVGLAVSMQESRFNPRAISYTGCCLGLKQINYKAHKDEYSIPSRESLFDKEANIRYSYQMLSSYKRKYGSVDKALMRYYGSTIPEQNVAYAQEVLNKAINIKRSIT